MVAACGSFLIYEAGALFQKVGKPHPAERSNSRGQKLIEPSARLFRRNSKMEV
jgi:hypothetical protein